MRALASTSAWTVDQVESLLASYRIPLRVAARDAAGFPLLCSLWFEYRGGGIHCATQRTAAIARSLAHDPRCAFELAPNEPPYYGVRGRGRASISSDGAEQVLGRLVDRYLGDRESDLARWLMDRCADEVVISIEIDRITSWDYRGRMRDAGSPPPAPSTD